MNRKLFLSLASITFLLMPLTLFSASSNNVDWDAINTQCKDMCKSYGALKNVSYLNGGEYEAFYKTCENFFNDRYTDEEKIDRMLEKKKKSAEDARRRPETQAAKAAQETLDEIAGIGTVKPPCPACDLKDQPRIRTPENLMAHPYTQSDLALWSSIPETFGFDPSPRFIYGNPPCGAYGDGQGLDLLQKVRSPEGNYSAEYGGKESDPRTGYPVRNLDARNQKKSGITFSSQTPNHWSEMVPQLGDIYSEVNPKTSASENSGAMFKPITKMNCSMAGFENNMLDGRTMNEPYLRSADVIDGARNFFKSVTPSSCSIAAIKNAIFLDDVKSGRNSVIGTVFKNVDYAQSLAEKVMREVPAGTKDCKTIFSNAKVMGSLLKDRETSIYLATYFSLTNSENKAAYGALKQTLLSCLNETKKYCEGYWEHKAGLSAYPYGVCVGLNINSGDNTFMLRNKAGSADGSTGYADKMDWCIKPDNVGFGNQYDCVGKVAIVDTTTTATLPPITTATPTETPSTPPPGPAPIADSECTCKDRAAGEIICYQMGSTNPKQNFNYADPKVYEKAHTQIWKCDGTGNMACAIPGQCCHDSYGNPWSPVRFPCHEAKFQKCCTPKGVGEPECVSELQRIEADAKANPSKYAPRSDPAIGCQ